MNLVRPDQDLTREVGMVSATRRLRPASILGFTLLELMLVVILLGLVLAVSYPSLSRGSATIHLHAVSRDVLNMMRYAREKAITGQSEMRVAADRESRKVVLTDELGEGARTYELPRDVRIERMSSADQEVLEGPLIIRFLPNGSAGKAEIVLKSDTGATLMIVTDPIIGGARVVSSAAGGAP